MSPEEQAELRQQIDTMLAIKEQCDIMHANDIEPLKNKHKDDLQKLKTAQENEISPVIKQYNANFTKYEEIYQWVLQRMYEYEITNISTDYAVIEMKNTTKKRKPKPATIKQRIRDSMVAEGQHENSISRVLLSLEKEDEVEEIKLAIKDNRTKVRKLAPCTRPNVNDVSNGLNKVSFD